MEKSSPINQAILQLKELQQSEVYQYHCRLFSEKCVQLSEIAQQMIPQEESLHLACQEHTVQEELAVQCRSLYRGFYCPSPVYDLIVGNTHRGRILKKPNKKSKPTHIYGFDSKGKLLWCQNNEQRCREYLVYENDQILGISFNADATIQAISEETYREGKLISFYIAYFYGSDPTECILKAELYEYDDQGLYTAKIFDFTPPQTVPDFLKELPTSQLLAQPNCHCIGNYRFTRENGLLVSYRRYDLVHNNPVGETYAEYVPRKA